MELPADRHYGQRIAEFLTGLRNKDVTIWSDGGELRYRAPKGAMTREDLRKCRECKDQIIAVLSLAGSASVALSPREPHARIPLTFSQLERWRDCDLADLPSVRHLTSATRLRGPLDFDALEQSIGELIARHEALRTRIAVEQGVPYQVLAACDDFELTVEDLTHVSDDLRDSAITSAIDRFVLAPIDVTEDPLFGAHVLRIRKHEHILLLTTEHLISDGFSMNVLLRDLRALYSAAVSGRTASLPDVSIQFPDYAVWQQRTHPSWMIEHGGYWRERLRGCGRLPFPADEPDAPGLSGYEVMPLTMGADLKKRLKDWSRSRKTTLVMGLFTAYVALMMRWSETSDLVLQYQLAGRMSPEVENAVGYFACVLHLRLQAPQGGSFSELMQRVLEEYYTAHEHVDFNYLLAQTPPPEFAGNGRFNWISQEPKGRAPDEPAPSAALKIEPVPFKNPVLKQYKFETNPSILLWDRDDDVVGGVYYPARRYSADSMKKFAREYLMLVEAMIRDPDMPYRGDWRWRSPERNVETVGVSRRSAMDYGTDSA